MKIGCAVLAGGKSSRMGTDKALLELDGKNFIKKLCDELDFFEEKIIARGNRSDLKDISWKIIPDIYPQRGPIGGLHAVLSICESDALFCVSCDMPLLQNALVKELCEYFKFKSAEADLGERCVVPVGQYTSASKLNQEVDAVIAVTEDGRKHPLCGIYRKSVFPILEEQILLENHRMMAALDRMRVEYVILDSQDSQQLKNINTPEDYQGVL